VLFRVFTTILLLYYQHYLTQELNLSYFDKCWICHPSTSAEFYMQPEIDDLLSWRVYSHVIATVAPSRKKSMEARLTGLATAGAHEAPIRSVRDSARIRGCRTRQWVRPSWVKSPYFAFRFAVRKSGGEGLELHASPIHRSSSKTEQASSAISSNTGQLIRPCVPYRHS